MDEKKGRKPRQPKASGATSERSSLCAVPATPSDRANKRALEARQTRVDAFAKRGLVRIVGLEPARFPGFASGGECVERSQGTLSLEHEGNRMAHFKAAEAATMGCQAIADSICKTLASPATSDTTRRTMTTTRMVR